MRASARQGKLLPVIVVSSGCPASIGPEVSVRAAARLRGEAVVLVGDEQTLAAAAELVAVPRSKLKPLSALSDVAKARGVYVHAVGPKFKPKELRASNPSKGRGLAQLLYIEAAAELCQRLGAPLVTAAVSKAAIAHCGEARAESFRGHTEWLQELAAAPHVTMCFWTPKFSTSLVTTHLPIREVPAALNESNVAISIVHLVELLRSLGHQRPRIAVSSLNPHAGESGLLGDEEGSAIGPGMQRARQKLGRKLGELSLTGAETAYRLAATGRYDGVVAMYHDQATIPAKLLGFGDAVNVTMGLGYTRTSVDHGTAYDIAWRGVADARGMLSALRLARRLTP